MVLWILEVKHLGHEVVHASADRGNEYEMVSAILIRMHVDF